MAVIKITLPSGKVRWQGRHRAQRGAAPLCKNFDRKADAEAWERQQIAEALNAAGERRASGEKTLADLGAAHNAAFDRSVDDGARARVSLAEHARHLRQVCEAGDFAARALAKLDTPDLQELLEALREQGLSVHTVLKIKTSIHTWMKWGAVRKDFLTNPALVRPCTLVQRKRRKGEKKWRAPNAAELELMFAAAEDGPAPERDLAMLSLLVCGGLRISEMLGMADEAAALEGEEGRLQVNERLCSTFVELGDVKTEMSQREVPVGPETVRAVKAWRLRRGRSAGFRLEGALVQGRLFPGPSGRFWRYNRFRTMCWNPLMKRAGLGGGVKDGKGVNRPWVKYSPHDMRHAYATMQIAAGVDAKTLQTWMGHATLSETEDTYAEAWEANRKTHLLAARIEQMIPRRRA